MLNEREIALNIIMELDAGEASHSLMRDVLGRYDYLLPKQKAFIKRLSDGTLERRITLDYIIDQFASVKSAKQKPLIRSLLRMSVYQIFYMDSVPDSAAINEAVNLAGKRGFVKLKGFINGVLRNIARDKDKITFPLPKKGNVKSEAMTLSVTYSMPELICKTFLNSFGYEETENILKAFLQPRPVILRMDERQSHAEMQELIQQMKEMSDASFTAAEHPLLPYAYELTHTDNIQYLPGYEEGKWMVQDVSSMLVTEAAGIKAGDTIIDVCSAPGGKALHAAAKLAAAEKGAAKGSVTARDLSDFKVGLIDENSKRMGLEDIVSVQVHDATVHDGALENKADVLYCDLPCSGLGIIGRKADIKYAITKESLKSLTELQKTILQNVWNYVKVGGTMMYSTCTINPYENEQMVAYICENLPFERVDLTGSVPEALRTEKTLKDGYLQLVPGKYGTDGFFFAKLKRIK